MNRVTCNKIQIFACVCFLVCTKRIHINKSNIECDEEYIGTTCQKSFEYIPTGNSIGVKKRLLARYAKDVMSQKNQSTPSMADNTQYPNSTDSVIQTQNAFFTETKDDLRSNPINTSCDTYSHDTVDINKSTKKPRKKLKHTSPKDTVNGARVNKAYEKNSESLREMNEREMSVSGRCYFEQLFADVEYEATKFKNKNNQPLSQGIVDFKITIYHAMSIYKHVYAASFEQHTSLAWNRQSNINLVAYNIFLASRLSASAREILMHAYGAISFKCIDKNRLTIIKYLSLQFRNKDEQAYEPKYTFDQPEYPTNYQSSMTLDISMKAMEWNLKAGVIQVVDCSACIYNYMQYLRSILYGEGFKRRGSVNPAIKLLIPYMFEFMFYIEERIRFMSSQRTFDTVYLNQIIQDYTLLSDVLSKYELLCRLKIIQLQEYAARLADEELNIRFEKQTYANIKLQLLDNAKEVCTAEGILEQAIKKLRNHIKDSIADKTSNRYLLYDEAMRLCSYKERIEKVTRTCGLIYFILAFTQECDISIAEYKKMHPNRSSHYCIKKLLQTSVEFTENTILTLQIVCEYLSHGKRCPNKITLVHPEMMRAYVFTYNPLDPQNVKKEITRNFLCLYFERISSILSL